MKFLTGKRVKRFICILMVVVLLFNVIAPTGIVNEAQAGLGGILLSPISSLLGGIAFAFQAILNGILGLGEVLTGGELPEESHDLFISDIVYNELAITKANIFDTNTTNANPLFGNNSTDDNNSGLKGIVSTWYQISRMIALAATLVMLVYVAIQILISSTGQSKAKYMDLLKDWLLCLLLIFTMHYILSAILFISDWVSAFFLSVATTMMNGTDPYKLVMDNTFNFNDFSIIYAIIWLVLLAFTFIIFIAYIKRLILICFIVIISPLVILASTIDKLRGKGGGLLSNMLKEFSTNVIIQPLDALLFTIIISAFTMCMEKNMPLPAVVFIIVFFMLRKWLQKFLGQESSMPDDKGSMGMAVAGGAALMGGAGKLAGSLGKVGKGKRTPPKLPTARGGMPGSGLTGGAPVPRVSSPVSGASTKPLAPAGTYTSALYGPMLGAASTAFHKAPAGTGSTGSSTIPGSSRGSKLKGGAKVAGRLGTAIASKGVGLAAGITMASLDVASGKSGKDVLAGFTSGYEGASSLTGSALKASGRVGQNIGSSIKEHGIKDTISNAGSSIKDFAQDKLDGSEILHGEKAALSYKQEKEDGIELAEFYADDNNRSYILEAAGDNIDASEKAAYYALDENTRYEKALNILNDNKFAQDNANKLSNIKGSNYHKQLTFLKRGRKKWGKDNGVD